MSYSWSPHSISEYGRPQKVFDMKNSVFLSQQNRNKTKYEIQDTMCMESIAPESIIYWVWGNTEWVNTDRDRNRERKAKLFIYIYLRYVCEGKFLQKKLN